MCIVISKEFSKTPGARYRLEGKYSGEEFRDDMLEPAYLEALRINEKLFIDLDGGYGYPTSFLEEAFGGLARKYEQKKILSVLEFKSEDQISLVEEIRGYILDARKEK